MLQRTRLAAGAIALAATFLPASPAHAQTTPTPVVATPGGLPAHAAVELAQLHDYVQAVQLATYVDAVQRANVVTYADAVAAAEAVAPQHAQAASGPTSAGGTVTDSGSCYGGPIPDYIVTRESGGNPMAQNPSGAFGCYQIMPEWWSGACSAYDRYTIAGQKACAAILWNGGAGASNWALTR
jgi:hypothetical protein